MRIAGVCKESIVDGPGIRFVIFAQGCPHKCEGCHNPATHDFEGGFECSNDKLLAEIDKNPLLRGVTFSGGEPMCKAKEFYELANEIKNRGLNILIFTGYTYEELEGLAKEDPYVQKLIDIADYMVDGPFILAERDLTLKFRGSRNQRYIDLKATKLAGKIVIDEK